MSQLKYGSKYNLTNGIFDTLRENLDCLMMDKLQSQTEVRIGFFLGINPKTNATKITKTEYQ